jgi:cyanophycinase
LLELNPMSHKISDRLRNGSAASHEAIDGRAGAAINCPGSVSFKIISLKIMSLKMSGLTLLLLLLTILLLSSAAGAASYQYIRIGDKADSTATPVAGTAMMGGGKDLDEAFRWLCQKANGGDFLVLRAHGDDDYNPYVNGLCKLNSVATLIIPDRNSAQEPAVADIIRHAEAVFIAGGDQSRYVNFWRGTPVEDAINSDVASGKPIGGTSAGLAILGEFAYGCLKDKEDDKDLASTDVLPNPYHERVTLVRDFLKVPNLENTLTDSHFAKRDRMGRTLGFLARLVQDGWSKAPREVAIDEKSAVLVEPDGKGTVVGSGHGAYFLQVKSAPEVCRPNTPLTIRDISVYRAPTGAHFDFKSWTGVGGESYSISVENGMVHSAGHRNAVY